MKKESVLVVFGEAFPLMWSRAGRRFDVVVAPKKLRREAEACGSQWEDLEDLVGSGSMQEASAFLEELSDLTLPNGSRLAKVFIYKGYELWWTNYNNLFRYYCVPYTQYKLLLEYLKNFQNIYFYQPPYQNLFSCYLQAHGRTMTVLREPRFKSSSILSFGILIQMLLTLVSIPLLMFGKRHTLVFTGDKFEKDRDYDFRMKFIYEELREREIVFVEFIRSLESWKTVLAHAWRRRRPVVYAEAISFIGRFMSVLSGGRRRARRAFGPHTFASVKDPELQFRFFVATQFLLTVYDTQCAIWMMRWIVRIIGIKVAIIEIASDRTFPTVLGCKLNDIPTIGILHGVSSPYSTPHDYLPRFSGEKMLTIDRYGVWSEWWKEQYLKKGRAYHADQLYVSGPMRPLERSVQKSYTPPATSDRLKVLFIAEQLGYHPEALPYLMKLVEADDIDLYIKFRPYRDGFEAWLTEHHPDLLKGTKILRGTVSEAVAVCDAIVGSNSTAALEALLQRKPPIFYHTKKWGDYFDLQQYDPRFFAKTPEELIKRLKESKKIPKEILKGLQERFFGDPYKNGSAWVVDQVEKALLHNLLP